MVNFVWVLVVIFYAPSMCQNVEQSSSSLCDYVFVDILSRVDMAMSCKGMSDDDSVQIINLIGNREKYVPDFVFEELVNKTGLERDLVLFSIFNGIFNLTMLETYTKRIKHLTNNELRKVEKLKLLGLNNNQKGNLDAIRFTDMSHVKTLYLYGNNLTSIPRNILSTLPGLEALHLGYNRISELKGEELKGVNVHTLYMQRNSISSVEDNSFKHLKKLSTLHLWSNKLKSLKPKTFSGLIELRKLFLDDNELSDIPRDVFSSNPKLTVLSLRNNNLQNTSLVALQDLKELEYLFLNGNHLTQIAHVVNISDRFPHLKVLDVRGNDLHCDQNLLSSLRAVKEKVLGSCSHPQKLKGKLLKELATEDINECKDGETACSNETQKSNGRKVENMMFLCPVLSIFSSFLILR